MIDVNELKPGATFLVDSQPYRVVKYTHTKMGRGNASIKVIARNMITGATIEKGYNSGARLDEVSVFKKKLQFLYKDQVTAYFMDPSTYEQVEIPQKSVENELPYIKEGDQVNVCFWEKDGENLPLYIDISPKVVLKVADCEPGVKGNSAVNIYKEATLENGLKVKVPLFVEKGELVRVDTRTGEYIERAKE